MTQEEIDVLFSITITIHENEWFGKGKKRRDRNEVQRWVAQKLANALGTYTIPVGSSWGTLVPKFKFDEYWKEHSKLKQP